MRGWFLLDLLAAIPFDLLYAFDVDTVSEFRHGPALTGSQPGTDRRRAVVMDLVCVGSIPWSPIPLELNPSSVQIGLE